ncbi:unnamed protein product [Laminaria digitata]
MGSFSFCFSQSPVRVQEVAICILSRRSGWKRRHLLRQTWLQEDPEGAHVSHIFVVGEDRSFTPEENALLAKEVEAHGDILIAPSEEALDTVSNKTKHCIYWVTRHHDFDVLIKTNDDSALFLSRLVGTQGWLREVGRDELLYFGKRHALDRVPNPAHFESNEAVNTDALFEFDYRGVYWPEHMEGGMYGLSRRMAEEIVKNDFTTYASEDAMVGVWVSAFRAETLYLADPQVLSGETDYLASNGTSVVASFGTDVLRLASMWCEYTLRGALSPRSILVKNTQQALDCLIVYESSSYPTHSHPLGARKSHEMATLLLLQREWPIEGPPDLDETGQWWARMGGAFRGKPAAVVGASASLDRLPLYLLQEMNTLVMDDFFRVSERYTTWAPSMYMCVDPVLCASGARGRGRGAVGDVASANKFARSVFAAFYVLRGGVDGVEYWRHLRQRVNAHWFVAGAGAGAGGASEGEDYGAAGMGAVAGTDTAERSSDNFRVLSRASGVAMGVEVLSYLGFSPVYITAANEELATGWEEVSRSVELVASTYGTQVIYLYTDKDDKLPKDKVKPSAWPEGDKTVGAAKLSAQEEIQAWAKSRSRDKASARWDLQVFLQHYPVVNRLEIVRGASSVEDMFPRSMHCRDADDLDRFQKAVLCSVKVSLKHFSSFLTWHVPYGPVRGTFVWTKR